MGTHLEEFIWSSTLNPLHRLLGGGGDEGDDGDGHHSEFGVHIQYEDLYAAVVFFTVIYAAGVVASRGLRMPSLVGEIFAGILLGPPVADFVPNPEAFVLLGEAGLVLLVLEAGIEVDLTTLKLIGARGVLIAIVGSILPIAFGVAIAFALGFDTKQSLAAGASFGPTSLGIAMNILRQGKLVNTPVGQLIVSAAVIDDMIALVILSQLSALTGEITAQGILIPIISALCFLVLGGYIAINILPGMIHTFILSKVPEEKHAYASLGIMFAMVLALMPATYYADASYLMGTFIAGLTFCRDDEVHHFFSNQFKRLLQWLMRIFFAASIGFQVPIKDFNNVTVLWQGAFFCLALAGKIAVGFMAPNFGQTKRFNGDHLRDCLITGFSMAAEGEFAFVIAVFGVDNGLISKDLYASIVLAVLVSTIIPPFLLRYTVNYYNQKAEERVRFAAEFEFNRNMDLEGGGETVALTGGGGVPTRNDLETGMVDDSERKLRHGIENNAVVFLCIQIQCQSKWGMIPKLLQTMRGLKLEIIDHRSWHPRGYDTTLVNEIYAQDSIELTPGKTEAVMSDHFAEITLRLRETINQEDAKVKVTRWFPGVLEEIVEEEVSKSSGSDKKEKVVDERISIRDKVLLEASRNLEKKKDMHLNITKSKSVHEILSEAVVEPTTASGAGAGGGLGDLGTSTKRPRRIRQKMRSTPVMGGDLFGEQRRESRSNTLDRDESTTKLDNKPLWKTGFSTANLIANSNNNNNNSNSINSGPPGSEVAELIVGTEVFRIRLTKATLTRIRAGYSGGSIEDSHFHISPNDAPIEVQLQGHVRQMQLTRIAEETTEHYSETSSDHDIGGSGGSGNGGGNGGGGLKR